MRKRVTFPGLTSETAVAPAAPTEARLVVVHNHPSGDPSPSRADIEMTREVQRAAAALGIAVHDHLIVGRAGHASLKGLGLI